MSKDFDLILIILALAAGLACGAVAGGTVMKKIVLEQARLAGCLVAD